MCSPICPIPDYKEPRPIEPCFPVQGPCCLPCGIDPVTLRRPLIVHDSTFDYRPTSWPGMIVNNQDKKVRYQLINYDRVKNSKMCDRMRICSQLQNIMSAIKGPAPSCCRPCCGHCCSPPPCCGGGSLITVYSQVANIQ